MNFLAHAWLSFNHPQIMVGNMISDFVKGKSQYEYPLEIQYGIRLHRKIDSFTDVHPATRKASLVFHSSYRLYSGALVDIIYDHFLANDTKAFSEESLLDFSLRVYNILEGQSFYLPQRFLTMLPYMKRENWLLNYKSPGGIERSLRGLVRRAAYLSDHETAFRLFNEQYTLLQECYDDFFEDVKNYSKDQLAQLLL